MSPQSASNLDHIVEPVAIAYGAPREPLGERVRRALQRAGDTIAEYAVRARTKVFSHTKASSYTGIVIENAPGAMTPALVTSGDNGTAVQFVWSPSPGTPIDARAVVCIELPARNPLKLLESYVGAGVRPQRIVFVGDPLSLSDAAYDGITRMGSVVCDTGKKANKERAEQELAAHYAPPALPREVPLRNPNPYTWDPGPPRVTPEQLQALIDGVRARR